MHKKVLTEIALIYDEVKMPKGFEIDNSKLKADILSSCNLNKSLSNNPYDYKILDYEVPFSRTWDMLNKYVCDHLKIRHNLFLVPHTSFGNIFYENEQSFFRNLVNPMDLQNAPDFTMVYGVDIFKDSANIVFQYDDNREKNNLFTMPLITGHFILFPSTQKFFISKNTSKQINTVLTTTFIQK
jgi:hypothetical protein